MARQVKVDYREARLPARPRALCEFAEKVTLTPSAMRREDLDVLRGAGLTDEEILDAVQVVSYFNYINRVADALGVDPEPEMKEAWRRWPEQG